MLEQKRRGAAEVATEIRRMIKADSLQLFERLPSERVMSENYGVSRGTIRDALMRLEREGLVEIRPGSGTYVIFDEKVSSSSAVRNARPLELIDTRFALEPHICRLAVLHGQQQDFERIEAQIAAMENCKGDRRLFSEADTQFHLELVKSTGNSLLIWIINQINDVRGQPQWDRMRRVTLEPEIIETYNTQHRMILDAIRGRDPERAAMLMKDHLTTARNSLTRAAET